MAGRRHSADPIGEGFSLRFRVYADSCGMRWEHFWQRMDGKKFDEIFISGLVLLNTRDTSTALSKPSRHNQVIR
jgi:hypothetical protein